MIVYIYNIGVDLYNGFNGLRHRINWTYFTVLDGLAHPLYSNPSYRKVNPLHRKNTAIPNKPAPITQVTSYPIVNNGSLLIN